MAKERGKTIVFIPLHRGADGFMSPGQFETFYWPTLKKLVLALVSAGLTPAPFFEGDYTSRLEYLLELPKGKILALQRSPEEGSSERTPTPWSEIIWSAVWARAESASAAMQRPAATIERKVRLTAISCLIDVWMLNTDQ